MHILEEGVSENSQIFFVSSSDFASRALFCLQHIGNFYCDSRYMVKRDFWETVLIMFVDEGKLSITYDEINYIAEDNDIVVLDCRRPHSYRALGDVHFHYFHFVGISTFEYIELLYRHNESILIKNGQTNVINNAFSSLMRLAQGQPGVKSEHRISLYIHMILGDLVDNTTGVPAITNESIKKAIEFMEANVTKNLSMEDITNHVNLSRYHFNRSFHKQMGSTPHQYFNNMRIQHARQLLVTTYDSVGEVAEQCGFDDTSNFIRLFKRITGMTPAAFRKLPF